jgi:hypothetical protein
MSYISSYTNIYVDKTGISPFDVGIYMGCLVMVVWSVVGVFLWYPLTKQDLSEYHLPYKLFIEEMYYMKDGEDENAVPENINERNFVMIYHDEFKTNIIMSYDTYKEGFQYWTNHTIPYESLLAVARKYCTSFNSWGLYHGNKREASKERENKFIHVGTVNDFKFIQPIPKKHIKIIDYKSFKMSKTPTTQ